MGTRCSLRYSVSWDTKGWGGFLNLHCFPRSQGSGKVQHCHQIPMDPFHRLCVLLRAFADDCSHLRPFSEDCLGCRSPWGAGWCSIPQSEMPGGVCPLPLIVAHSRWLNGMQVQKPSSYTRSWMWSRCNLCPRVPCRIKWRLRLHQKLYFCFFLFYPSCPMPLLVFLGAPFFFIAFFLDVVYSMRGFFCIFHMFIYTLK